MRIPRRKHTIEVADPHGHLGRWLELGPRVGPPPPGTKLKVTVRGKRTQREEFRAQLERIAAGGTQ